MLRAPTVTSIAKRTVVQTDRRLVQGQTAGINASAVRNYPDADVRKKVNVLDMTSGRFDGADQSKTGRGCPSNH